MNLYDEINDACRDLPEGYEVAVRAENGAAWVELEIADDNGNTEILDIDGGGTGIASDVKEAVRQAIEHHRDHGV